jgi:hypothetical protein
MPPTVFRDGGHPRSAQGRMHFPASRHRNGFLGHAKWVRAWDADFPPCPLAFLADGLSRASLEVALKSFETFSRSKQPPGNVSSTVLKRFGAMLGDVFPEHFNIGPPSKTYRITRSRGSPRCPHAVRSAPRGHPLAATAPVHAARILPAQQRSDPTTRKKMATF